MKELEALSEDFVGCKDVIDILHVNYEKLHLQAVNQPEKLGFPVCVIGKRVRIPRLPFIAFVQGERMAEKE